MRGIRRTTQFKRDVKRMERRGKDLRELATVLRFLSEETPLPAHYQDHLLLGQYKGVRECHRAPDWLLLYEAAGEDLVLIRTGTYADLFV